MAAKKDQDTQSAYELLKNSAPYRVVVEKNPKPLECTRVENGYAFILKARSQAEAEAFVNANKLGLLSCSRVRNSW